MSAPTIGVERFTDPFMDELRRAGDPPADAVVADYLDGYLGAAEGHLITELIAHGTRSRDEDSAPLRYFVTEHPVWPDWADFSLVNRGQALFLQNAAPLGIGLWMASIPAGYAAAHGAEVLTHTARMVSDAKRRFVETGQFIIDVMTPGGLDPGGDGARDIRHVRLMHAAARHLLMHHEVEGAPPFDVERFGVPLNQEDLLGTLFTFSVVGLEVLERSGIHVSAADREAYVHAWSVVGHGMGIRDDLLPLDHHDSQEVFAHIQRRTYAPSEAGKHLTAVAIEVMREMLGLRVLGGVPAAGIRHYLGDEVADLLDVPSAGMARAVFRPARWVDRMVWGVNREFGLGRRVSQALGRRLFTGFLALERHGASRPQFELSEALAEQLNLE